LAGETALALRMGHRISVDLDWFIPKLGESEALFLKLKSLKINFEVQWISFENIYLTIHDVQVGFIGLGLILFHPGICPWLSVHETPWGHIPEI